MAHHLTSANSLPQLLLSPSTSLIALVLGIMSHNCLFIRGEWHILASLVLKCHLGVFLLATCMNVVYGSSDISESLYMSFQASCAYLSGLFISMKIYPLCFHRLRSFPGPLMVKNHEALACIPLHGFAEPPSLRQDTPGVWRFCSNRSRRDNHLPSRGPQGRRWARKKLHESCLVRLSITRACRQYDKEQT